MEDDTFGEVIIIKKNYSTPKPLVENNPGSQLADEDIPYMKVLMQSIIRVKKYQELILKIFLGIPSHNLSLQNFLLNKDVLHS